MKVDNERRKQVVVQPLQRFFFYISIRKDKYIVTNGQILSQFSPWLPFDRPFCHLISDRHFTVAYNTEVSVTVKFRAVAAMVVDAEFFTPSTILAMILFPTVDEAQRRSQRGGLWGW